MQGWDDVRTMLTHAWGLMGLVQGTVHARQQTGAIVRTSEGMHKLFSTMAERYRKTWGTIREKWA